MDTTTTGVPAAPTPEVTDGRSARRVRGRQAVVDAAVVLMEEKGVPTADDLAAAAGVSRSSLFRYFDGMGEIWEAVVAQELGRHGYLLVATPEPGADRSERIAHYVDVQLELHTRFGAKTKQLRWTPDLPSDARRVVDGLRTQIEGQVDVFFGEELGRLGRAERADLASVIKTLISPNAADAMVDHHGRSVAQIRRAWTTAIDRLLPGG